MLSLTFIIKEDSKEWMRVQTVSDIVLQAELMYLDKAL